MLSLAACKSDSTKPETEQNGNTKPVLTSNTTLSAEQADQFLHYNIMYKNYKKDTIKESIAKTNAVAEYRIVKDSAWLGPYYYSLQVFSDGTGTFTYWEPNEFYSDKIDLNKTKFLNLRNTEKLLNIIEENDFWNIPTINPDEIIGCDGYTLYVEGYDNGKSHIIKMWCPDDKYGIKKIFYAFDDFARKVF